MESVRAAFRREGLVRVRDGRVFGGVITGIGRRLGIDPWPARILFLVVLMLIPGSQLLIYPVLWLTMPEEDPNGAPLANGPSFTKSTDR